MKNGKYKTKCLSLPRITVAGEIKVQAFDSGDAIRDVTEKLRDEGFLVESVSAYKQWQLI